MSPVSAVILIATFTSVFGQKQGETCFNERANFLGRCKLAHECPTAESDYLNSGIYPKFCEYSIRRVVVCCKEENLWSRPTQKPSKPKPTSPPVPLKQNRVSQRKCDEYSKAVVHEVTFINLLPEPETMSISDVNCNYTGIELIVGGVDAIQGEFPHMAAIGWPGLGGDYEFSCGGSLISRRFVLSAGHCIKKPRAGEPTVVRLGDQNLNPNVKDGATPVDVRIKMIHKHPDYKPPDRYNDIALFELVEDVTFSDNIRPACLWTEQGFGGHDKAIATGWGVTNPDKRETSDELKKVGLSLLTNEYCDRIVSRNRFWDGFVPSQMCAGELAGGKDTCQGDSGAPLQVVSKKNQCIYYVVGLTSFGGKCAQSGQPAIYTRVSSYLDWIEGIVWPGE